MYIIFVYLYVVIVAKYRNDRGPIHVEFCYLREGGNVLSRFLIFSSLLKNPN